MRVEATRSASPVPASQAEKVSMMIGRIAWEDVWACTGHMARATYIDSIIPSRHSRAEIRCVR